MSFISELILFVCKDFINKLFLSLFLDKKD